MASESAAVFESTYGCRNCGNEWSEGHDPRTIVEKSTGIHRVVVRNKDCDEFLTNCEDCCYVVSCPVCQMSHEVRIVGSNPLEENNA